MPNADRFPLARLPYVALMIVMKLMSVRDQFQFLKLSKNARQTLKSSTSRQSIKMKITDAYVELCNTTTDSSSRFQLMEALSNFKSLLYLVVAVFKNFHVELDIKSRCQLLELVPFMKTQNITLDRVEVFSSYPDDELCEKLLRVCKDVANFEVCCKTTPRFQPKFDGPFFFNDFKLEYGTWFTVNHLINNFFDCRSIRLDGCNFTVADLNKFFKAWVNGSKIERFKCVLHDSAVNNSPLQLILDGTPLTPMLKAYLPGRGLTMFGENKCFLIQQSEGSDAIVFKNVFSVQLTTKFSLNYANV